MKFIRTICTLGGLALPFLASAASSRTLEVHVPFSFMLAGEEFAPGDYHVQQNDNGVVLLQGRDKSGLVISFPGHFAKPGVPSSLQFTSRQPREYHLVGVNMEGEPSRVLPVHAEESRKETFTSSR